jgi:hypothetical protein
VIFRKRLAIGTACSGASAGGALRASGIGCSRPQGAQIADDALAVERHIATLIFDAQARGENVEHAVDADPRALLGVTLVVAPRAPSTGTSSHWQTM